MFKVSMIKEDFVKKELREYLCPNQFFKLREKLYFISEDLRGYKNINIKSQEELYSGVEVSIQGKELFIDNENILAISNIENDDIYISNNMFDNVSNNTNLLKELNKNAFLNLFNFFRPEFGKNLIQYDESILPYILTCMQIYDENFANAEEDEITLEVMRHFKFKGKLVPGYYDGNIICSNIKLYDFYSETEVCSIGNQALDVLLYLENDDKDSLAALAESLTKEQIIETFIKSIQAKIK